jgi:hypothetical protein
MASATLHQTILDEEQAAWDALSASGPDLLPLLSPKCVMLFQGGFAISASTSPSLEEVLRDPSFEPWKSFTMTDVHVIPLGSGREATEAKGKEEEGDVDANEGPSAALIHYRVEAMRETSGSFAAVCASTWEKVYEQGIETGWRMVSHQQTLC